MRNGRFAKIKHDSVIQRRRQVYNLICDRLLLVTAGRRRPDGHSDAPGPGQQVMGHTGPLCRGRGLRGPRGRWQSPLPGLQTLQQVRADILQCIATSPSRFISAVSLNTGPRIR